MKTLPPEHPPVGRPSSDTPQHSAWREAARWICAGLFVLAVHAAGAYVLQTVDDDQPAGAPVAAMAVELAPEPMAPAEEQVSDEVRPEMTEAPKEEEPTPPEPEKTKQPDPQPQQAETPPEPAPQPDPKPVQQAEEIVPDVAPAPNPEVVAQKPEEKPQEKIEPKPDPKPEPKKVEKPKPKPKKPKPEKPRKPKPRKAEPAPASSRASAPHIDADNGPKAATNRRGQNSASPGVDSNKWLARMNAHMQRIRRAVQGRAHDASGRVVINFVIDPSGNVLSVRLAGSSGDPTLDRLVVEAARQASPVPAPPPALARARMPITLPLVFR
ncbi:MAG: energy transducer TonB [Rhizobiales bacterium 63-22]|nr:MAG: energy transducer TonB [Rhizobiales bacterium 63-22]